MKNKNSSTESLPPKDKYIDKIPLNEALDYMIYNQFEAVESVKLALNEVSLVIENIYKRLSEQSESRIIYVGAGTSGRIAVQDGVELYPTFGWPETRINYIIAGGLSALTNSVENAEDSEDDAKKAVENMNLSPDDIVIALAASSNTPFTVEVARLSKIKGCFVVGIGNNVNGKIQLNSSISITLNTGAEVLAGSTRLKAGTSQKVCLNIISTMVMAKMGRVKDGQMNYLRGTNSKLRNRKEKQKF